MFSLYSKFQNINNFKFIDECGLFYLTKDEKLYRNEKFLFDCYGFESNTNNLFCYTDINNVNTYLISNCIINKYDFAIDHESFNGSSAIIKNKENSNSEKYGLYNFNDKSTFWLKNLRTFGQTIRLKNNLIHRQGHYFIKSFSLLSDSYEWQLELSGRKYKIGTEEQEAKIIKILGLYENQLLVFMQGDRLISIDINKGTILSETLPFEGLLNVNGFQITDFKDLELDVKSGKIFMLNKHYYYEINLNTHQTIQLKTFFKGNSFEIGRLSNIPENTPKDLIIVKSFFTENYIYFIGGYGLTSNMVGAFNRTTYEIDWQEAINLSETDKYNNLKDISYSCNNLYILDTEGTLRIFKKNN